MLGKIVLVIIMAGVLAGAAATSISRPVLVTGALMLFALSAAMRRQQQG